VASMTSQGVFSPDGLVGSVPLAEIERTLGAGLKDLASELRLIDATDFAAFIRIGHMANLRSLVQSSAELHFKPGTLELAELGEIELGWFKPPLITLPMKFRHGGVRVYFRLRLAALSAAVEVESIAAESGAEAEDLNLKLREALRDARAERATPPAGQLSC
jgi:hypothetical protein